MNKKKIYKKVGDKIWQYEIVIDYCENCTSQKKCFDPFLKCKTDEETEKQIDIIRNCKKRYEYYFNKK